VRPLRVCLSVTMRAHKSLRSAAIVGVIVTLLLNSAYTAEAIAASPTPPPRPESPPGQIVAERPDRVSAALTARLQGSRVLITGETTESTLETTLYSYDQADRLINHGYTYDAFGRTTTVPAVHISGREELALGYHADDIVAWMSQGNVRTSFALDPEGRIRSTTQAGGARPGVMVNHYDGPGDNPAWVAEPDGSWTRNIAGLREDLAAIQYSTGKTELQLANLHGDVVAIMDASSQAASIEAYFEQIEYGAPRSENIRNPTRYGWLGTSQRSADAVAGIILMGVRLYNPATGRFLQVDPVKGASANDYDYCYNDPVNCRDLDGQVPIALPLLGAAAALAAALAAAEYIRRNPVNPIFFRPNLAGPWSKIKSGASALFAKRKKDETQRAQQDRREHRTGASRSTKDKHEKAAAHGGRRDYCNPNKCRNPQHSHGKAKSSSTGGKKKKKK
jgi:RHS repeat-associated protein